MEAGARRRQHAQELWRYATPWMRRVDPVSAV